MAKLKIRFNHLIRVPEVRLIDEKGEQLGVMNTRDALRMAREKELDLVEVSPNADPPVCKILDYGKYAYDTQKKMRESRKRSQRTTLKEVQFRPKIGKHDYDFKMRNAARFLKAGDKVRIVVRFRGRENAHPEVGETLLLQAADELKSIGAIELRPRREGRIMFVVIAPNADVAKKARDDRDAAAETARVGKQERLAAAKGPKSTDELKGDAEMKEEMEEEMEEEYDDDEYDDDESDYDDDDDDEEEEDDDDEEYDDDFDDEE